MADFLIEKKILERGGRIIAGVDEVGRGALFGPVVAAAVVFPRLLMEGRPPRWVEEVDDSKVLTPRKREALARQIIGVAEAVGIGMASNREVDRENILRASILAMKRAVQNLVVAPDFLLIDGRGMRLDGLSTPQMNIPHGDKTCRSISAASVVAKVLRDRMMAVLDGIYKGYDLCKNKGYGTKGHYRALSEKGPTPFHRLSFRLTS